MHTKTNASPLLLHQRYNCLLLLLLALTGCAPPSPQWKKLKTYDLDHPEKFLMPESLLDISGIAFNKGNPDTIYAIQDQQGRLYRLKWNNKKQSHSKFAKNGNYEDLAIINGKVIVLKRNGSLYVFPLADTLHGQITHVQEWKNLVPKGEYEGLWASDSTGRVYVLCKKSASADSNDSVPGYVFQLNNDELLPAGAFAIAVAPIRAMTGRATKSFRPSALAANPVSHEWFILSSVNKMLVIADSNWTVKAAYHLDGNRFNQPEGLAFDGKGNLYISNEGDHLSEGNILKFTRKQP